MREQLIAAIEDNPDDVENYRVYADWLEANNQPRGQLITMELLRERLTDRPKREHLSRRIAEYVQRHRGAIFGGLKSWPELRYETQYGGVRWRYGFIHTAQIGRYYDTSDALARLRELLACPSGRFLVVLELHASPGQPFVDVLLDKLPRSLRRLEIACEGVDLSPTWPALARLAHLGLRQSSTVIGTLDLPRLETLVAQCSHLTALREARIPVLETLRVERADDPSGLAKLFEVLDAKLTRLELESSQHTNEIVERLSGTKATAGLVEIDLTYGQLTDAGARKWAKHPPAKRLRKLVVKSNQLTRVGIQMLRDAVAERVVTNEDDTGGEP